MKISKHIITFILIILLFSCQTKKISEKLIISATLNGFDDNTSVKLIDANSNKTIDSTILENNHFILSKKIENEPKTLFLVIGKQTIELFVGNENIKINGTKSDFPDKLKITGSENQKMKMLLDNKLLSLNNRRMELLKKMFQLRNENKWNDKLQKQYWGENGLISNVDKQIDSITKNFILNNVNTDFSLTQLIINKSIYSKSEVREVLSKLNEKYKNSKYNEVLSLYVNSAILKEGSKFADFKGENKNGEIISFSSLLNNDFILLDFSSPHCSWCKKAFPSIKKISELENVSVVTMWVNCGEKDWKEYYKSNNINWEMLWDKKGKFGNAYTKYDIYGTPTYFLINRNGIIVRIWKGYDENIEKEVENIIKNAV